MIINKEFANKVKHFAELEGMTNSEIAAKLNCSTKTIERTRKKYGISKKNMKKRKDKTYRCIRCKTNVYIRRDEVRRLLCPGCEETLKGGGEFETL